jgi:uncharacterized surface protein with fasciclin (FAS1) repeats
MSTSTMMTNIYGTAKVFDDYSMMIKLLEAAGLAETLRVKGPYTVFLPTDAAFKNLPTGTVEGWLNDLSKLRSVLNYHIVDGKFNSNEIHNMTMDGRAPSIATLQGSPVILKTILTAQRWVDSKQTVYVNDAKVVRPEITASNGMIHVIDRVLLPLHSESITVMVTPRPESTKTTTVTQTPGGWTPEGTKTTTVTTTND